MRDCRRPPPAAGSGNGLERAAFYRTTDMLILGRKPNESIVIGEDITITVCDIRGDTVRLGIDAPQTALILRSELAPKKEGESADG